jgi:hypothetical protein
MGFPNDGYIKLCFNLSISLCLAVMATGTCLVSPDSVVYPTAPASSFSLGLFLTYGTSLIISFVGFSLEYSASFRYSRLAT